MSDSKNGFKNVFHSFLRKNDMILSKKNFMSVGGKKEHKNANVFIIGDAGSGKTYNYIIPNILQANCSYVISDPGGHLFQDYAGYLEYMGYKIKCLNLINTENGNHYNPFRYIHDERDIIALVKSIIDNTTPFSGLSEWKDPFGTFPSFEDAEKYLLTALISFLHNYTYDDYHTFSNIMLLLRTIKESNEKPKFLDDIFSEWEELDPDSFAVKNYKDFKDAAGNKAGKVMLSCVYRLAVFDLPELKSLTRTDDIDLESVGDRKTAVFIVTPSADMTFNHIATMMCSQLVRSLYRYCWTTAMFSQLVVDGDGQVIRCYRADNQEQSLAQALEAKKFLARAKKAKIIYRKNLGWYELVTENNEEVAHRGSMKDAEKTLRLLRKGGHVVQNKGQHLPVHTRLMFDNINVSIKNCFPDFAGMLTTMRKCEMSASFTARKIRDLKAAYKDSWQDIIRNCGIIVFFGGYTDIETEEWLMMTLCPNDRRISKQIKSLTEGYTSKCIVIHDYFYYVCKKYNGSSHPMWNLAKKLGPYTFSEEKKKKLHSEEWGTSKGQEKQ